MDNSSLLLTLQLAGGILLLIVGRKLFWFLIGVAGFAGGLAGLHFFMTDPSWMFTLGAGITGAAIALLLAHFLKAVTFGLGGFLAGAYLVNLLLQWLGLDWGSLNWAAYILGGVVGSVLLLAAFEFALKLLTSLAGAYLITRLLPAGTGYTTVVFAGFTLLGLWFQSKKKKPAGEPPAATPNP